MKAGAFSILVLFFCILFAVSCKSGGEAGSYSQTRLMMDTYCTITICGVDEEKAAVLIDEAFRICGNLEAQMSVTIEGSDVWRVNHAQGQMTAIAPQTLEVIRRGIEFGELSEGMFDITIGRLSRLWNFYIDTVPESSVLEEARQTVNYKQVNIMEFEEIAPNVMLQLQEPGAWLDLGGIAKGYIADEIAGYLSETGIENALINLGGDIRALGSRPDGGAWRLGVRKPFGGTDEYIGVLEVSDAAVVSSGVYERCFEIDGVLYHHIIDPFAGMPAQSNLISATVIAKDAVTGEGLSTIAVLTGSERAAELFAQTEGFIGAVMVLEDGETVIIGDAVLRDK